MYNGNSYLAIIPARGGSKRLPKKNTLLLANKPLIAWSIEAALNSSYVDKVIVSSDSDDILDIAKKYGADTIKRPDELATDSATTYDTIKHVIDNTREYDNIVILQPTSPLRDSLDIDRAIELQSRKSADAIISVCKVEHSPLWTNTLPSDGSMTGFLSDEALGKRSQELQTYYRLNGAIYIYIRNILIKEKSLFFNNNIFSFIMDTKKSIDIDTEIDFKIAQCLIEQ
jgi:CMP-N-acetylneuraminic acid synthetase